MRKVRHLAEPKRYQQGPLVCPLALASPRARSHRPWPAGIRGTRFDARCEHPTPAEPQPRTRRPGAAGFAGARMGARVVTRAWPTEAWTNDSDPLGDR